MKQKHRLLIIFVIVISFSLQSFAQTTSFSYQGHLMNAGSPATGNFDLEFKLFDLVSAGTQQGNTVQRLSVVVTNGLFSVSLDFGAAALPGADRFLDIGVRTSGGGAFTALTPRQKLNSAPYSVKGLSSAAADVATNATQLGGIAANQYVVTSDPRMTDARSPTAGSTNYVQNGATLQPSSNFNISGNGTAGGTLSANILSATTQYNLGGQRMLSVSGPFSASLTALASNTFLGDSAGVNTTPSGTLNDPTGKFNTFMGALAGKLNTTGSNNSFFGGAAGNANTTGNQNSFFGLDAGRFNTTGDNNSFSGAFAGFRNTTQHDNTFVGYFAGQTSGTGDTTNLANFNTFVGSQSGQANTTGGNNTLVGSNANVGAGNLTNTTALGAQAFVTQNNSLVLGAINGVNGASADTNVGIGTTAPTTRLHVVGNGLITGNLTVNGTLNLPSFAGQFIQNTIAQQANSNFNISGSGIVGGTLSVGNSSTSGRLFLNRGAAIPANSSDINFYSAGSPDFSMGTSQGSAAPSDFSFYSYGTNSNVLTIQKSSGNVGVGTSAPGYRLHVAQDVPNTFAAHVLTSGIATGSSYGLVVSAGTNSSDMSFQARNQAGTSLMAVRGDGNVGIGTTTPSSRFTLNSTTPNSYAATLQTSGVADGSSYGLVVNAGTDVTDSAMQINSQSGTPFLRVRGNGNVGIGTTNPQSRLHVEASAPLTYAARIFGDMGLQVSGPWMALSATSAGGSLEVGAGGVDVSGGLSTDYLSSGNATFSGSMTLTNLGSGGFPGVCFGNNDRLLLCGSSQRFKENIGDFTRGLDLIRSLRPVTFDWKSDGRRDVGLIAEEVETVEPLLTTHLNDGQIQGVRYDLIGVVLINAVKEQQAQIDEQAKTIDELKREIGMLKSMIAK